MSGTKVDAAKPRRPSGTPWARGKSGNPKGRPSYRSCIAPAFLKSLEQHWRTHGAAVLTRISEEHPLDYVHLVASFVPPEAIEPEIADLPVIEVIHERADPPAA